MLSPQMEEPFSINADDWLVYADWLMDQDRFEEEQRARLIARSCVEYSDGLYLAYRKEFETALVHAIVNKLPLQGRMSSSNEDYEWLDKPFNHLHGTPDGIIERVWTRITPLQAPEFFRIARPGLTRMYFDKLANLAQEKLDQEQQLKKAFAEVRLC